METTTLLLCLLAIAGAFTALYGIYYFVVALHGFKKQAAAPAAAPTTRFAVVSAARNEEAVIGQLVDSLKKQNYPRHLYDIIVAPNNCTDHTRLVAQNHGAKIFDPVGPIHSKGDVMSQVVDALSASGRYDALVVFDADNLAHPDFLQKMNDAYLAGAPAAQGFRDSKNPADSAVATCYSVGYWMMNRFYNGGRHALGLSAQMSGCGFMASFALLRRLGGWHTTTLTEDFEFTAQCALVGEKVHYVPDAIFYDEQPLTFAQSWKQRRRWASGAVQGMQLYLPALVRTGTGRQRAVCLDLALTFAGPVIQLFSLVMGAASLMLTAWQALQWTTLAVLLLAGAGALVGAFLLCAAVAALVVRLNRPEGTRGTGRGAAYFAVFLLSHVAVTLVSLFRRQKTWEPILHTCSVNIQDLAA